MSALEAIKEELEERDQRIAELEKELESVRTGAPWLVDRDELCKRYKLKENWVRSWLIHRETNGLLESGAIFQERAGGGKQGQRGSQWLYDLNKFQEWLRSRFAHNQLETA